ncbi:MAG: PIN domain-containing protein [Chloracidobacterium sp.]|nr:PIN domain-containing protein [Chloracidobacterium sp.]
MILPDVNLLIYAYDERAAAHAKAKTWLSGVMDNEQVFLSWHTITAFLRIITNPKISSLPTSLEDAVEIVETWLSRDNVDLISLDKTAWGLYAAALRDVNASGNLVMDAHLAALAMSRGATLASCDRDFRKFDGLKTADPLKA